MRRLVLIIYIFFPAIFFYACETTEDISSKMDHEVPSYKVLTDSLTAQRGQTIEINVEVSDNTGLAKVVFSYGAWSIRESVSLIDLNYPKSYLFTISVTIPNDAEKEWVEDYIKNDGSVVKINQQYHKLNLEATDMNMNARNVPVYLRVQ